MSLVELARAVQAGVGPYRLAGLPQLGFLEEAAVGHLQILHLLRVPPDHDVGLGAQCGQVVDTADNQVLILEGINECLKISSYLRAIPQHARLDLEDRVGGEANDGVKTLDFLRVQFSHGV